jgi:hypothetical protein
LGWLCQVFDVRGVIFVLNSVRPLSESDARDTFKFLMAEGIGQDSAYFYRSYSEFESSRELILLCYKSISD